MSFPAVNPKVRFPELEKEILQFWRKEKIFQRSIDERDKEKSFTFYDGPPFATGLPHYGHILAHVIKDVVPRYQTMKGHRVERRFGWDCHGLPIENIKEKELGISGRKQIEEYGVARFNEDCRQIVQHYAHDWRQIEERMGRWVDMDNDYKTMDASYMESVWWVFKQLWDKGYVYEGFKAMQICPRCTTPLSNFEVSQGYKDVTDWSVIAKFPITDQAFLAKYADGKRTSFIAWTTTPWSVPTTMGLAIGRDFDYVALETSGERVICAEGRMEYVTKGMEEGQWNVVAKLKGSDIEGISYEHPFGTVYARHPQVEGNTNVYKTYATDYVSVEDGTGIVTINGAFGEIDMDAARRFDLPIVLNVRMDGTYDETMTPVDLANESVKPVDDPTKTDQRIAAILEKTGFLYRKETYRHSYPHCWRCDHPLLNYATKSWFVSVTKLKENLLKNNAQTRWVPETIRDGRFGKWLENARDWAVSRNRYWGAPLPVWKCDGCGKSEAFGSMEELFVRVPQRITKLVLARHGESTKQTLGINAAADTEALPLTEKGQEQAREFRDSFAKEPFDAVYCSPMLRTRQTVEGLGDAKLDDRLREISKGKWEGVRKDDPAYVEATEQFAAMEVDEKVSHVWGETGESDTMLAERTAAFLRDALSDAAGKRIVVCSHSAPMRLMIKALRGLEWEEFYRKRDLLTIKPGKSMTVYVDVETGREFDLHKHIVDELSWKCDCGGNFQRVPEVLDCWFESGSMPYAQEHYPFEHRKKFEANFPANFIAEGQDQTRGWFYTLMVLSTALFDKPAFRNVIVNGIVLAEDGKKMSKKLKNYPDPAIVMEQYGADAMRWYLMASPAVSANDLRFSEKGVDEVVKSVLLPLWNAYSFFVTYANIDGWQPDGQEAKPSNPLDQWILSELQVCITRMTNALDGYDLAAATKPVLDFIDGLTNWYIRRSRRRFWKSENDGDKAEAYATLYRVLTTLTQLTAPFVPFISEEMYRGLTLSGGGLFASASPRKRLEPTSVHLTDWPVADNGLVNEKLNGEIGLVRTVVSLGLRLRGMKKVKVRQPLSKVEIVLSDSQKATVSAYADIIQEELNVKDIVFVQDANTLARVVARPNGKLIGPQFGGDVQKIISAAKEGKFREEDGNVIVEGEGKEWTLTREEVEIAYEGKEGHEVASDQGIVLSLDFAVTPELEREGIARELVRTIQDLRKEADYGVSDRILIGLTGVNDQVEQEWGSYIEKETLGTITKDILEWDQEAALPDYGTVGVKRT